MWGWLADHHAFLGNFSLLLIFTSFLHQWEPIAYKWAQMTNVKDQPITHNHFQSPKINPSVIVHESQPFRWAYFWLLGVIRGGESAFYFFNSIWKITTFNFQSKASILLSSSFWSLSPLFVVVLLGNGLDEVHRNIPGIRDVQEPFIRPALLVPWTWLEESVFGSFVSVSVWSNGIAAASVVIGIVEFVTEDRLFKKKKDIASAAACVNNQPRITLTILGKFRSPITIVWYIPDERNAHKVISVPLQRYWILPYTHCSLGYPLTTHARKQRRMYVQ